MCAGNVKMAEYISIYCKIDVMSLRILRYFLSQPFLEIEKKIDYWIFYRNYFENLSEAFQSQQNNNCL